MECRLTRLCLPTLLTDPPMIRLFCTFEYPHPSSGVNKRPLTSATGTVGISTGGIEDICDPPNIEKIANSYGKLNCGIGQQSLIRTDHLFQLLP